MEDLRYPIGKFAFEGMSSQQREQWINDLEQFPKLLKDAVAGLNDKQLDTPYRTGGWTIRQLVHHLADASMNGFTRFKLALTENNPTIKPFNPDSWANLIDGANASISPSLLMVEGIYVRWVQLLRSMQTTDFAKQFYHPERGSQIRLSYFLGFSAWHVMHHLTQITNAKLRKDW
ncbi:MULTISPECIES: YfiT family bacillithiol transferase [unclassified Paenibacillus]|uniref:YfiT family bacillithiol transferase n=1 Tax=unclassified Paenibacillus TaxID=185978 RepID=UPI002F401FFC